MKAINKTSKTIQEGAAVQISGIDKPTGLPKIEPVKQNKKPWKIKVKWANQTLPSNYRG